MTVKPAIRARLLKLNLDPVLYHLDLLAEELLSRPGTVADVPEGEFRILASWYIDRDLIDAE